jgi:hypothetical protein
MPGANGMKNEFKTPRFILTAFFTLTTTFAYLLTEKMNSDQYIIVMGLILGAYGTTAGMAIIKSKKDANV